MIDFKDFKKTKEDGDTVTMAHHRGHEIKILKRSLPSIQQEALKRLPFKDGGEVQDVDLAATPAPTDAMQASSNPNGAPLSPEPVSEPGATESMPQGSPLAQQAQGTLSGVAQQQTGLAQQADVQARQAQGMVPIEEQRAKNEAINQENYANALKDVTQHTNEFAQHLRGMPINPNAYGESQTDAQKSQTALGLFLGGLGGGNGPNPALEFLENNINRNIAAQKQNQENERTIYGAYQDLYHNDLASAALTKVSMNDKLLADAQTLTAKLGTDQAKANFNILSGKVEADSAENRMKAAGYLQNGPSSSGSSGNANPLSTGIPGGILGPGAEQAYKGILYDPTKTDQQKHDATTQYNNAVQVDKALKQIDVLFPQIKSKATFSGDLADRIDPRVVGGAIAAGTEGIMAATSPATGGASLAGAIPAALAAGAGGTAAAAGTKQILHGVAGQQGVQYDTAKDSLVSIISSALGQAKITPTEIEAIAKQFTPHYWDSADTVKDKLEKLKAKIKSLTETSALEATPGMMNKTQ